MRDRRCIILDLEQCERQINMAMASLEFIQCTNGRCTAQIEGEIRSRNIRYERLKREFAECNGASRHPNARTHQIGTKMVSRSW